MVGLAVLSVALVFWYEQLDPASSAAQRLVLFDLALVVFFAIEWTVRFQRAEDRRGFLRRNWYDLPGLVPLAVASSGIWRLFRLARVMRVLRAVRQSRTLVAKVQDIAHRSKLVPLGLVASGLTVVGSLLVWLVERDSNAAFASYGEALWWAVVTVTTVGYGDITPLTPLGRALAVVLMAVGIGVIGMLASQLAATLVERNEESEERASAGPEPVETRLARLAELHAAGRLTDEEFARAKEHVLG